MKTTIDRQQLHCTTVIDRSCPIVRMRKTCLAEESSRQSHSADTRSTRGEAYGELRCKGQHAISLRASLRRTPLLDNTIT